MGVIRYKIWYDLWENKGRTLRVVMIIAIGAFAVGTIFGGTEFLLQDVAYHWSISEPATIGLEVEPPVTETMIESLENIQEIEQVIGRHQARVQWRASPTDLWEPAILIAVDDYEDQTLRKILLDEGAWPHRKMMGVQRGRGLEPGDTFYLEIGNDVNRVEVNGVLYNVAHPPAFVAPEPMFFTTQERFSQLTGTENYSLVLATIPDYSNAKVERAADLLQHELEKQNVEVGPAIPSPGGFKVRTSPPHRFIAQDVMDGVILILRTLAVTTLVLGLFLVYNTINSIIVQQVNQIGIMKAVGARFGRIFSIYVSLVFAYAFLALVIAVPTGALGARGLQVGMVAGRLNMIPSPFEISSTAVMVQVAVAIMFPLLVSIGPILSGARITVREAVSSYGLATASSLLERLLAQLEFIPRMISLTLSNTFRNKKRVLLTQMTLIGAGVIFMMVLSVQASILYTFRDVLFSIFEVNVMLDLKQPERIKKIKALSFTQPEVKMVEVWGNGTGTARPAGEPEALDDEPIKLRGVPIPTETYEPQIRQGRWLIESDTYAIVLNQALAQKIGTGVGEWLTIDIPTKRESDWQVVGLVFEPVDQDGALVPRKILQRELRQTGQGQAIKIKIRHEDAESEARTATHLTEIYEFHGYEVQANVKDTAHRLVDQRTEQMSILLILLSGMAILIAVVGAVALSGTLSINVMERTREIGVMRAIGASSGVIAGQFVGEGLILGWLSWLIAIPLSIPVGRLIVQALASLLNIELVYQFSTEGILYWLLIVTVLAVIASWFPAQKAAQTSVRESLAYT